MRARLKRYTRALVTALALACAVPAVDGCAAGLATISTVATVVSYITSVLDSVEDQVEERGHAIDPAATKAVLDALAKARSALLVVQAASRGVEGVASKDYAGAVDALMDAYAAVLDLTRAFGVRAAPLGERARMGAAHDGALLVPPEAELRHELMAGSQ